MHRLAFQAVAVSVALALASVAQAADLKSVYEQAKKYDATFAAAEAAAVAGREKTEQARALWLPQVNLSTDLNHQNQGTDFARGNSSSASGTSYDYTVSASQPLYNAAASVGNSQLLEQARLAEVSFAGARQSLILRVAQAYFDVLYAQDSLDFVRAQKDAVAQQLAQAKKSFEVGVSTITDTHEAQASFDAIVASEIASQNNLLVKQNAFAQLTGVSADGISPLVAKMQATPPEPNDMNSWLKRAEEKSLEIAGQRSSLAIADADIDRYRTQRQPTLSLVGRYGESWNKGGLASQIEHNKNGVLGLQLNIPLYTGGATSSKLRESIALRDQAQFKLEATRRDVAQTTKAAFLGVQSGAAQIKALEQALVSAQSSLDSTSLGREVGVRTTLDVLNAEQKVYSTKRDLAQARYAYLVNKLNLSAAVGELAEADIDAINAQLKH
ncbi:TolC family outer membrane protein [Chitinimonas sp.]|uniref:TolC family outer membrane protein n=1 Tax=Chitinimonas sp. TaxID=1934313 RepID=UPI0035AEC619